MKAELTELLPLPRHIERTGEGLALASGTSGTSRIGITGHDSPALERLIAVLHARGVEARRVLHGDIRLTVGDSGYGDESAPEGYELRISSSGVDVVGNDAAGLFHGTHTLAQLVEAHAAELPGLVIRDAPSFPHRGVMLDLSRDRVPTLATLFELVDRFSAWKLNELQLYVEHTFAYPGHESVWRDASPLTPDEVRALDDHCQARHVRLIPNQQCFGHMHHWLRHERYRHLAECPEGVEHPFLSPSDGPREPFSLAATDPASLAFVESLLTELLPAFRADTVNVGCDETFDLGLGRSREACEERGVGRVYLEYIQALAGLVHGRLGKRMQVWADILLDHPELVPELPAGVVPMLWGYEADHPFQVQTQRLAECRLPYYVCPGTSSWQSLGGRLTNAVRNIESATRHGHANGAIGVLVTDWGDRGHLQPLVASYPGWVTAADLAWNAAAPAARRTPEALAELLSRHVFLEPPSGGRARALVALARVGEATGAHCANASPLSIVLTRIEEAFPPPELSGLTPEGLDRARAELDRARSALESLEPETATEEGTPDHTLAAAELRWIADLLDLALDLARARLAAGAEVPVPALGEALRAKLAHRLTPLIREHGRLWAARSRPGGRERSVAWLERVARLLG